MSNENRFKLLYENKREKIISEKEFTKEFLRKELEHNKKHPCFTSQPTFNRILNYKGIPLKVETDILLAYSEYFNVSIDYLLCSTDIPFKNKEIPRLEELGLSSDAILYIKNASEYEQLTLDTILKKEYFWDICHAIYSYMQTYYKEIQIQDASTENVKLQDNEKMEFAEYRATKQFSDTLINKIAKDEDIRNYNNYEHEMETLRHALASDNFQNLVKQADEYLNEYKKRGKGGYRELINDINARRAKERTDANETT